MPNDTNVRSDSMADSINVLDFIRPQVRERPSYPAFKLDAIKHRMHWNEHPFDLPAELKAEILAKLVDVPWSHYTEFRPTLLEGHIARHHGLDADNVVVTPSSSVLIRQALSAILDPGDTMVYPAPAFLQYRSQAALLNAIPHEVTMTAADGFALPVDAVIAAAREQKAKLVIVCAPNNPTGTVYSMADLKRIVAESGCLVLIDEAYAHFSYQDLTPLLAEHENVILARTFSKAFAMAGVRVGYGLTSPTLAAEIRKLATAFPVNVFTEVAVATVLENPHYVDEYTKTIVAERQKMAEMLDDMPGMRVFPSGTNFLLIQMEHDKKALVAHLRNEHSLLIGNMQAYPQLGDCIRISIGTPEQNELVVHAIGAYIQ